MYVRWLKGEKLREEEEWKERKTFGKQRMLEVALLAFVVGCWEGFWRERERKVRLVVAGVGFLRRLSEFSSKALSLGWLLRTDGQYLPRSRIGKVALINNLIRKRRHKTFHI